MRSAWEREQLSAIERRFEIEDPRFARAFRDAVPPAHHHHRGAICVVTDLVAAMLLIASVVLASFPLLAASAAVVTTALTLHIMWPPEGR